MNAADIKALRRRLELTQRHFCERYCIPLRTLQNWEQERRLPDPTARALLHLIDRIPDQAAHALASLEAGL